MLHRGVFGRSEVVGASVEFASAVAAARNGVDRFIDWRSVERRAARSREVLASGLGRSTGHISQRAGRGACRTIGRG